MATAAAAAAEISETLPSTETAILMERIVSEFTTNGVGELDHQHKPIEHLEEPEYNHVEGGQREGESFFQSPSLENEEVKLQKDVQSEAVEKIESETELLKDHNEGVGGGGTNDAEEQNQEEAEDKLNFSTVIEEETPMVIEKDSLLPKETEEKSLDADAISEDSGGQQKFALIQDDEHVESRAVEVETEVASFEPLEQVKTEAIREIAIAEDPTIEEGHQLIQESGEENETAGVKETQYEDDSEADKSTEVVLEDHASIEKVNQTGDGDEEITDNKAEQPAAALDVEVGVSGGEQGGALEAKQKEEPEEVNDEQGQQVHDDQSLLKVIEDQESLTKESTETTQRETCTLQKNEIEEAENVSIGDVEGPTAEEVNTSTLEKACVVNEDAEEQTQVETEEKTNLSAVIEEDKSIDNYSISEDAAEKQGHPSIQEAEQLTVAVEDANSEKSKDDEENRTVEAKETTPKDDIEAEESTDVLAEHTSMEKENEVNQIGDGDKEEVSSSVVLQTPNECKVEETNTPYTEQSLVNSSVEVNGNTQAETEEESSGTQVKESETVEVVSSEIEVPEIYIKSEDAEGKDKIEEPEKQAASVGAAEDSICDDISNEEVNDEQGSAESSGEVKKQVVDEIVHAEEIHDESASIPETEDQNEDPATILESIIEKDVDAQVQNQEEAEDSLQPKETEDKLMDAGGQNYTLIQDEEQVESRAVDMEVDVASFEPLEQVSEDTEATKELETLIKDKTEAVREITFVEGPKTEEGHQLIQEADEENETAGVKETQCEDDVEADKSTEVVLEDHATIEKVNQAGDGDEEITDNKAEQPTAALDVEVGVSGGEKGGSLEGKKEEEPEEANDERGEQVDEPTHDDQSLLKAIEETTETTETEACTQQTSEKEFEVADTVSIDVVTQDGGEGLTDTKEDLKVPEEDPEVAVVEISSVKVEAEEVKGLVLEKASIVNEDAEEQNQEETEDEPNLSAVIEEETEIVSKEDSLQSKETEDKSTDANAITISEDGGEEQGHSSIQEAEQLTVALEENETVEANETSKDDLEAEESTYVVLAEHASLEKENEVSQIDDGDKETADKEEVSPSAELQTPNEYQVEEINTAQIAEPSVPSEASTPPLPLELVESSSSVIVAESEMAEAAEEEVESNSYVSEEKETPTVGDSADETVPRDSEACEVPEFGVKAKEYSEEASYAEVEANGNTQADNEEAKSETQESESETKEVVSSEIEVPQIHIKSEDTEEGKDKIEEQPEASVGAAKDSIFDDISNEGVNDEQVSAETSGEVKEEVIEEVGQVEEIHEGSASIPETENHATIVESVIEKDVTVESEETENLESSSAEEVKEVCLEKEEPQRPVDFEVDEKKPEDEDETLESPAVQEIASMPNEITTQEEQSASEQVQDIEMQNIGEVNDHDGNSTEQKVDEYVDEIQVEGGDTKDIHETLAQHEESDCVIVSSEDNETATNGNIETEETIAVQEKGASVEVNGQITEEVPSEIEENIKSEEAIDEHKIDEPEKQPESTDAANRSICDSNSNEGVSGEQGNVETLIEERDADLPLVDNTEANDAEIEKEVNNLEGKEPPVGGSESNPTEIERSKMQMQDSSSTKQTEDAGEATKEVIMEEDASYDKIGSEDTKGEDLDAEVVEVLGEQPTEEPVSSRELTEDSETIVEDITKEAVTVESEETEKHELSAAADNEEVCLEKEEPQQFEATEGTQDIEDEEIELIQNVITTKEVNDQQTSPETSEEVEEKVFEKQTTSEGNETGNTEEIHQTSDEHVTERSCDIEIPVIKEDISTEEEITVADVKEETPTEEVHIVQGQVDESGTVKLGRYEEPEEDEITEAVVEPEEHVSSGETTSGSDFPSVELGDQIDTTEPTVATEQIEDSAVSVVTVESEESEKEELSSAADKEEVCLEKEEAQQYEATEDTQDIHCEVGELKESEDGQKELIQNENEGQDGSDQVPDAEKQSISEVNEVVQDEIPAEQRVDEVAAKDDEDTKRNVEGDETIIVQENDASVLCTEDVEEQTSTTIQETVEESEKQCLTEPSEVNDQSETEIEAVATGNQENESETIEDHGSEIEVPEIHKKSEDDDGEKFEEPEKEPKSTDDSICELISTEGVNDGSAETSEAVEEQVFEEVVEKQNISEDNEINQKLDGIEKVDERESLKLEDGSNTEEIDQTLVEHVTERSYEIYVADVNEETPNEEVHIVQGEDGSANVKPERDEEAVKDEITKGDVETEETIIVQENDATEDGTTVEEEVREIDVIKEDITESEGSDSKNLDLESAEEHHEIVTETDNSIISTEEVHDEDKESYKTLEGGDTKPIYETSVQQLTSDKEADFEEHGERDSGIPEATSETESSAMKLEETEVTENEEISYSTQGTDEAVKELISEIPSIESQQDKEIKETEVSSHVMSETIKEETQETETKESITEAEDSETRNLNIQDEAEKQHEIVNEKIEPIEVDNGHEVIESESIRLESERADDTNEEKGGFNEEEENAKASESSSVELQEVIEEEEQSIFSSREIKSELKEEIEPKETISGSDESEIKSSNFEEICAADVSKSDNVADVKEETPIVEEVDIVDDEANLNFETSSRNLAVSEDIGSVAVEGNDETKEAATTSESSTVKEEGDQSSAETVTLIERDTESSEGGDENKTREAEIPSTVTIESTEITSKVEPEVEKEEPDSEPENSGLQNLNFEEATAVDDVKLSSVEVLIVQGEVDEIGNVEPERDEITKGDVETEETIVLQENDATEDGTTVEEVVREIDVIKEDITESEGSDSKNLDLESAEEQQEIVTETDKPITSTEEVHDEVIESDKTLEGGDTKPIYETSVQHLISKKEADFEEHGEGDSGILEATSETESSAMKLEETEVTEDEEISYSTEDADEAVKELISEIPSSESQPDKEIKETEVSSHVTFETIKEETQETETKESITEAEDSETRNLNIQDEAEKQHEIVNEKIEPIQVDNGHEVIESESIRLESDRADNTNEEKGGFNEAEENAKASESSSVELQEVIEEEEHINCSSREITSELMEVIEPKETISGSEDSEIKSSNFEEICAADVSKSENVAVVKEETPIVKEVHIVNDEENLSCETSSRNLDVTEDVGSVSVEGNDETKEAATTTNESSTAELHKEEGVSSILQEEEAHSIEEEIELPGIASSVALETRALTSEVNHESVDSEAKNLNLEEPTILDVTEADKKEITYEEEKGTVSGECKEAEDTSIHIKGGNENETREAEIPSTVTIESTEITSEVEPEVKKEEPENSGLQNLNFEEATAVDDVKLSSVEAEGPVSGESKEAEEYSREGDDETKENVSLTFEATEIISEAEPEAENKPSSESAGSEINSLNREEVTAADVKQSEHVIDANEEVHETADEIKEATQETEVDGEKPCENIIGASEATECVKFTEEEEKYENEVTKQSIEKDVDAAKENYETITEERESSTAFPSTVQSEETDSSYDKSLGVEVVDEAEAKLNEVASEKGSELTSKEEAEEEGGLQDYAPKDAVISDGGPQIVSEDRKITPEVKSGVQSRDIFTGPEFVEGETKPAPENIDVHPKEVEDNHEPTDEAEKSTTGVVERNIDTSYVMIDGKGFDETSLDATSDKADLSLSDLLHKARDQNQKVATPLTEERVIVGSTVELHNEADAHEAKTDEERDEAEGMVESSRDIDVKTPKKHSNILSGVSSKVKHSISKVKKAITGKSSNSKTKVSKMNEALPAS